MKKEIMKKEIMEILKKNTQLMDIVDEIDILLKNKIWEIASDILKSIGVKSIKTTYFKK